MPTLNYSTSKAQQETLSLPFLSKPIFVKRRAYKRGVRLVSGSHGFTLTAGKRQSQRELFQWLNSKKKWLLKEEQRWRPPLKIEHLTPLPLLGQNITLHVQPAFFEHYQWKANSLFLETPLTQESNLRLLIQKAYREKADVFLKNRLRFWSEKMALFPSAVKLKNITSFWGTCSSSQIITLNQKLIVFPKATVDYVLVHELSHLIYMGHGPQFWNKVAQYIPDYKKHVQHLSEHIFVPEFLNPNL